VIDTTLHTLSVGGTMLIGVALGVAVYFVDEAQGSAGDDPYANMVIIDAALAEKSNPAEDKQPQMETRPPDAPEKPVGQSRDENAAPTPPKDPPKKPVAEVDPEAVLAKNRAADETLPVDKKPKIETGRIDGVEVGFGDKTFGNRYLGELKSRFMKVWAYPEILEETGIPIACIRLDEDGRVKETKLMKPSENKPLDDSVERALAAFEELNNKEPKPLPITPDDLTFLARMPLCWRLKV
jgi:hypothetical protein